MNVIGKKNLRGENKSITHTKKEKSNKIASSASCLSFSGLCLQLLSLIAFLPVLIRIINSHCSIQLLILENKQEYTSTQKDYRHGTLNGEQKKSVPHYQSRLAPWRKKEHLAEAS